MKRLLFIGLAIWFTPALAFAQTSEVCVNQAALQRDLCLREARASGGSDRQCYSGYISAIEQCRTISSVPVRPIQPIRPIQPRPNR